jgi:hypothetical protein
MIVNCNQLWTQLVSAVFKVRRLPMVTSTPPPPERPTPRRSS